MRARLNRPSTSRGVTLLELVTVVLIIAILVVILLPVYAQLQSRAEKAGCIANLHSLHVATNLYLQDHHSWPQAPLATADSKDVATFWINTLQPYGLSQVNWLCPTVQKSLQNPDMTDSANVRVDYTATPFDSNPQTPFRWSSQPWFVEMSDSHGNGQLVLFPDGHVEELGDILNQYQKAHPTGGN